MLSMMLYQDPEKCPTKEPDPEGVCVPPPSTTSSSNVLKGSPLTTALLGMLGSLVLLVSCFGSAV